MKFCSYLLLILFIAEFAKAQPSLTDFFTSIYSKELNLRLAKLEIRLHPENNGSLAMARKKGNLWLVDIHGGYLDWPQGDGSLKLLVCHELGHLFENAVRYNKEYSIEGVADYFAGAECAKRVFDNQEEFLRAAEDLTTFWWNSFYPKNRGPKPSRTNTSKEQLTHFIEHHHHEPQCRLDIMIAGYQCSNRKPCRPDCWVW